jgi:branched-chain amino acid transport system ATP-binding protein
MANSERDCVLRVEELRKDFRGVIAVIDASLEVYANEVLGIIGPNGAGKTTLFNLIAGTFRPTRGKVMFGSRDITRLPPHRRLRLGIARTFQLIRPFPSLTVYENVYVAATGSGRRGGQARDATWATLSRFGLTAIADRLGGSINAVEGKRLEIARAAVTEPRVILLDGVFAGMNSEEVGELSEIVSSMRTPTTAVMLIEHNVGAIRSVAQRAMAMTEGAIICEGTPDEVLGNQLVMESYLGRHAGP